MLQVDMTARVRKTFGKGAARTLRRSGWTPANLYGSNIEPMALELETKSFMKTLLSIHRQNAVISLDVDDSGKTSKRHVMTKEIQTDPVEDSLIHADFYEISLDTPMTLSVPIKFTGKAKGVELGGELHLNITSLELKGKVLDVPDFVELDISPLEIGDSRKCQDIKLPENVTMQTKEDAVCVSVAGAREYIEEPEEPVAAAEPVESAEAAEAAE